MYLHILMWIQFFGPFEDVDSIFISRAFVKFWHFDKNVQLARGPSIKCLNGQVSENFTEIAHHEDPISNVKVKAVLLCGGTGRRIGSVLSNLTRFGEFGCCMPKGLSEGKQFLHFFNVPVFVYSLAEFLNSDLVGDVTIATKTIWNVKLLEMIDRSCRIVINRIRYGKIDYWQQNPELENTKSDYADHLNHYPFFVYDLKQMKCLLHKSQNWSEALHETSKSNTKRYKLVNLCISGDQRYNSVYNSLNYSTLSNSSNNLNGLKELNMSSEKFVGDSDSKIVIIHDGARPLVRYVDLRRLTEAARVHGAVVPGVSITDTVRTGLSDKDAENEIMSVRGIDRLRLFSIQTPQAFEMKLIKEAYDNTFLELPLSGKLENERILTDDAGFVEHFCKSSVKMIKGHKFNIKLTTEEDIDLCGFLLKKTYFS